MMERNLSFEKAIAFVEGLAKRYSLPLAPSDRPKKLRYNFRPYKILKAYTVGNALLCFARSLSNSLIEPEIILIASPATILITKDEIDLVTSFMTYRQIVIKTFYIYNLQVKDVLKAVFHAYVIGLDLNNVFIYTAGYPTDRSYIVYFARGRGGSKAYIVRGGKCVHPRMFHEEFRKVAFEAFWDRV